MAHKTQGPRNYRADGVFEKYHTCILHMLHNTKHLSKDFCLEQQYTKPTIIILANISETGSRIKVLRF